MYFTTFFVTKGPECPGSLAKINLQVNFGQHCTFFHNLSVNYPPDMTHGYHSWNICPFLLGAILVMSGSMYLEMNFAITIWIQL